VLLKLVFLQFSLSWWVNTGQGKSSHYVLRSGGQEVESDPSLLMELLMEYLEAASRVVNMPLGKYVWPTAQVFPAIRDANVTSDHIPDLWAFDHWLGYLLVLLSPNIAHDSMVLDRKAKKDCSDESYQKPHWD
jgi:hypothetical protein